MKAVIRLANHVQVVIQPKGWVWQAPDDPFCCPACTLTIKEKYMSELKIFLPHAFLDPPPQFVYLAVGSEGRLLLSTTDNKGEKVPISNGGQISIPNSLREYARIKDRVVFLKSTAGIELWSKEKFNQIKNNPSNKELEKYDSIIEVDCVSLSESPKPYAYPKWLVWYNKQNTKIVLWLIWLFMLWFLLRGANYGRGDIIAVLVYIAATIMYTQKDVITSSFKEAEKERLKTK